MILMKEFLLTLDALKNSLNDVKTGFSGKKTVFLHGEVRYINLDKEKSRVLKAENEISEKVFSLLEERELDSMGFDLITQRNNPVKVHQMFFKGNPLHMGDETFVKKGIKQGDTLRVSEVIKGEFSKALYRVVLVSDYLIFLVDSKGRIKAISVDEVDKVIV